MSKITGLPLHPTEDVDGTETLPIVVGGETRQTPAAPLVDRLAQPHVDAAAASAAAAEGAAIAAEAGTNYRPTIAAALTDFAPGTAFVSPEVTAENADGEDRRYLRTVGAPGYELTADQPISKRGLENPARGSLIVALPQGGRVAHALKYFTPEMFGAKGDAEFDSATNALTGTDDTAAINAAIAAALAAGGGEVRFVSRYAISGEVGFAGDGLVPWVNLRAYFEGHACLYAMDGFDGTRMIRVGAADGTVPTTRWSIEGGGVVCHARQKVACGIEICRAKNGYLDIQTVGALSKGIWIGSDADHPAGDVITSNRCKAWWWDRDVLPPSTANAGSIGVHFDRVNDCTVGDIGAIGYRAGIVINGSSNKFIGSVHPWTYQNCPMDEAVVVTGSVNTFADIYADSPTSFGDGTIAAVYGVNLGGYGNVITNLVVYLNAIASRDAEVVGVHWAQALGQNTIKRQNFQSSSSAVRFLKHFDGYSPDVDVTANAADHQDDFRVVETTKRYNYYGGRPSVFTRPATFNDTLAVAGAVTLGNSLDVASFTLFRDQVTISKAAENTKYLAFASAGIRRITIGVNADSSGGNLRIDRYNDSDVYQSTPMEIRRSDGQVRFHGATSVRLPSYTVATTPSPTATVNHAAGSVIYVTDGNAGAPCLAVSNGLNWLRVALGAAISTS